MLKLIALAALVAVGMPGEACADVFGTVNTKGKDLFKNVRTVVFIMGGFGLVGLAVAAIFGAVKWKWFASLAFGLAVVAVAASVIEYATGKGGMVEADTLTG